MQWIILGLVVIILFWIVSVYNSLITLKLRVENGWAQIDTQLKRRFDLIPNLVETVKGYAAHESGTLEKVIQARNMYASANTVEGAAEANNMLTGTLKTLFAVSENYPELKANQNFMALQTELTGTEDKVAYARQFYNDTVQRYNSALLIFPNNIISSMFKFEQKKFFEVVNDEQREAPKVSF